MRWPDTGWLSPDGDFFPCSSYEHIYMAENLVRTHYTEEKIIHPDENLLAHGWCQISLSAIGNKSYAIFWKNYLTEPQISFLKNYFENYPTMPGSQYMWDKEIERY